MSSITTKPDFTPTTAAAPPSSDSDASGEALRIRTLEIVRDHMPIQTLFRTELNIDLEKFIQDQMLFQRIAQFIAPLASSGKKIDRETIVNHFRGSKVLSDIQKQFADPGQYLEYFYAACLEVLTHPSIQELQPAVAGRIFTLKNALIAQHDPELIQKSQRSYSISQSTATIRQSGQIFICESLKMHLRVLLQPDQGSFQQRLLHTAEQLVPFVQRVTKKALQEHGKTYPDDLLAFRDPTGDNRNALVAAVVMEVCLCALGYTTQLMSRTDLDPWVTLATCHKVIRVQGPDGIRYLVDPSSIQFHKDIYTPEDPLPTNPVLVLAEHQVDDYIDRAIVSIYKKNLKTLQASTMQSITKILLMKRDDQHLAYAIALPIENASIPKEEIPADPPEWVRGSFKRLWGLASCKTVMSDHAYQEIFLGRSHVHATYDSIQSMKISSLVRNHFSTHEAAERLEFLLSQKEFLRKNAPEAWSLIAKIPSAERAKYAKLLDVDDRIDPEQALDAGLNAYFCSIRKLVNPTGRDLRVIYGCSGADVHSVFLATDAQSVIFIDLTPVTIQAFALAAQSRTQGEIIRMIGGQAFLTHKFSASGSSSDCFEEGQKKTHQMDQLPLKFLYALLEMKVDLKKVCIQSLPNNGGIIVAFPWAYHDSSVVRIRQVVFVTADITLPDSYPQALQRSISEGFDIFYMKAAYLAPQYYSRFLPHLARHIRPEGWMMTTDRTVKMAEINPEHCLLENGLRFSLVENDEIRMFRTQLDQTSDSFEVNQMIEHFPGDARMCRTPFSDITYWATLNLRKKLS